jgi:hypothetical protein
MTEERKPLISYDGNILSGPNVGHKVPTGASPPAFRPTPATFCTRCQPMLGSP